MPQKTIDAQSDMKLLIRNQLPARFEPFEGPVAVMLSIHLPFPKTMSKRKREIAKPTKRPDIDNYVKTALDAMNVVVWKDDSQVVMMRVEKMYSEEPRWEINVREVDIPISD